MILLEWWREILYVSVVVLIGGITFYNLLRQYRKQLNKN